MLFTSSNYASSAVTYRAISYLTAQDQAPIGIMEGDKGMLYVQAGGTQLLGVSKNGLVTVLASFPDPPNVIQSYPGISGLNGRFYSSVGQTGNPQTGNAFSVGFSAASLQQYAVSNLIPAIFGNLPNGQTFGTAANVSTFSSDLVTVDLQGIVNPVYLFPVGDQPLAPIYASDGNYYGTVQPQNGTAYFYRATPSGTLTKITNVPLIYAWPGQGTVLEGSDGNFYGIQTTGSGCDAGNQHGAVYKLTRGGQYTVLHDFGVCGPAIVNTLIEASDGNLYGAIQYNNEIFRLSTAGEYQVIFTTTNPNTQGLCTCIITQGSDGLLYGTALGGGPTGGYGLIFSLDAGLPIPKPQARTFFPQVGTVGTQVRLWGHNLLNATVSFYGTAATQVSSPSPNYILATVPAGATSGPIVVTTPGGTFTTAKSFTVQ